jgi:hypothetical protein
MRLGSVTRAEACALLNVSAPTVDQWLANRRARKARRVPYWAVELLAIKLALRGMGLEVPEVQPISAEEAEERLAAIRDAYAPAERSTGASAPPTGAEDASGEDGGEPPRARRRYRRERKAQPGSWAPSKSKRASRSKKK